MPWEGKAKEPHRDPLWMKTGSKLLRAAFWAACSNMLRKLPHA